MSGTVSGGKRAYRTNTSRYGRDYYRIIGTIGGSKSRTGGFYGRTDLARKYGALGGKKSRKLATERTELTLKQREKLRKQKNIARAMSKLQKIHEKARRMRQVALS